jgi:hypothetical protein
VAGPVIPAKAGIRAICSCFAIKQNATAVTREQDAAVRRRHRDVPSANRTHREEKGAFFGYFLCTSKESDSLAQRVKVLSLIVIPAKAGIQLLLLRCQGKIKSFHSLRERVTFFDKRQRKSPKKTLFSSLRPLFAAGTSMCRRRTAASCSRVSVVVI